MIQMTLVYFAHVQICQLHDLEVIVAIHFQVQAAQSIEVVLSEGRLCANCSDQCKQVPHILIIISLSDFFFQL